MANTAEITVKMLRKMKVGELRRLAVERGLPVRKGSIKLDLIEALAVHAGLALRWEVLCYHSNNVWVLHDIYETEEEAQAEQARLMHLGNAVRVIQCI